MGVHQDNMSNVAFGVKSYNFLLASAIEYHIKNNGEYDPNLKQQLLRNFYADNVVVKATHKKNWKCLYLILDLLRLKVDLI